MPLLSFIIQWNGQHNPHSVSSYTQILLILPCNNSIAEFIKPNVKADSVPTPYPNVCVHQLKKFILCCCQSLCLKVCLQNQTLFKIDPYHSRMKYSMDTLATQTGQTFWMNLQTNWIFYLKYTIFTLFFSHFITVYNTKQRVQFHMLTSDIYFNLCILSFQSKPRSGSKCT